MIRGKPKNLLGIFLSKGVPLEPPFLFGLSIGLKSRKTPPPASVRAVFLVGTNVVSTYFFFMVTVRLGKVRL